MVAIGIIGTYLSLTITNFSTVFLPAALPGEPPYTPGGAVYEAIYVVLTIAADMLYIVGGGIVAFGAILAGYRFVQCKLTSPYKPSCVTHFLSGYLTLGLELFIGAEIIKEVASKTNDIAGDGTTSAVLLCQAIATEGLSCSQR